MPQRPARRTVRPRGDLDAREESALFVVDDAAGQEAAAHDDGEPERVAPGARATPPIARSSYSSCRTSSRWLSPAASRVARNLPSGGLRTAYSSSIRRINARNACSPPFASSTRRPLDRRPILVQHAARERRPTDERDVLGLGLAGGHARTSRDHGTKPRRRPRGDSGADARPRSSYMPVRGRSARGTRCLRRARRAGRRARDARCRLPRPVLARPPSAPAGSSLPRAEPAARPASRPGRCPRRRRRPTLTASAQRRSGTSRRVASRPSAWSCALRNAPGRRPVACACR